MKDRISFAVLVAALIGAAAIWFFSTHEKMVVEERTEPAPEVRANEFFGFARYLETQGVASESILNLNTRTQLPDHADTLFFNVSSADMTVGERTAILDWVAAGGQLILRQPYSMTGSLLATLGFRNSEEETDSIAEFEEAENAGALDAQSDQDAARQLDHALLQDSDPVYLVYLDDVLLGQLEYSWLYYRPLLSDRAMDWSMSLHQPDQTDPVARAFAYGFGYGLGTVAVLARNRQISNNYFHLQDNSFIALQALSQNRVPGKVWFVSSVTRPDLWSLIWSRSAHLILWGALGTVFFFWWASQRFGRVFPDPPAIRREFQEHIAAGGRFLWRARQQDALLEKTRSSLRHKINRRYPHLRHSSGAVRNAQLEKIFGSDIALWNRAMQQQQGTGKQQFFEQVKALQELWKKI